MERIRRIFYKEKSIFYFDYRGLEDDGAFLKVFRDSSDLVVKENTPSLHIANITGVFITPGLIQPILAEIERFKPYVLRSAIVGVVGAKRVLFQAYLGIFGERTKAFEEETDALKWLVSE